MPPGGLPFLSRQEREERSRVKGGFEQRRPPCKPPPPIRECVKEFDKKLTHDRKCAPGEVQGGGGFDCGSNQLNASPKSASFGYFSCRNKKSTAPTGIQCFETHHSGFCILPFRRRTTSTDTDYCRRIKDAAPYNGVSKSNFKLQFIVRCAIQNSQKIS